MLFNDLYIFIHDWLQAYTTLWLLLWYTAVSCIKTLYDVGELQLDKKIESILKTSFSLSLHWFYIKTRLWQHYPTSTFVHLKPEFKIFRLNYTFGHISNNTWIYLLCYRFIYSCFIPEFGAFINFSTWKACHLYQKHISEKTQLSMLSLLKTSYNAWLLDKKDSAPENALTQSA